MTRVIQILLIALLSGAGCSEQGNVEGSSGAFSDDLSGVSNPLGKQVGKRSGEEIYQNYCFACHDHGAAGAPVTGRKSDWVDRMESGNQLLVTNVQAGLGAMPKNGSCFDCTYDELNAVVDFMLDTLAGLP